MKNTKITAIACYVGYVTQAIVLNLLPLFFVIFQNEYSISSAKLSFLIFLTFFVQIGIDLFVAWLGEKADLRIFSVLAHVMSAAGLVLLSLLPCIIDPFIGIVTAVVTYSVGSALLEVMINPLFDRLPQKDEKGFSFAHSFYCWGQMAVILLSALALGLLKNNWQPIPLCWSIIPTVNAIVLAFAPIPPKKDISSENTESGVRKRSFGKFSMLLFVIIMICAGAAEQGVAQWASYFAEKGLGTEKVIGDLLGPCTFALFMAIGRTLFSLFGSKINITRALTVCALSSAVCYAVIAFAPSDILSLAACALSGFAVSIMWPSTLDLASSTFYCGAAAFSILSVAGDIGCTLGPSVNGVVADIFCGTSFAANLSAKLGMSAEQLSIRLGFALNSLFPIIMALTLIYISKKVLCVKDGK